MAQGIAGRRFVLAPYGSAGDVYPFLWLGCELQRRGANVLIVSSPVFRDAAAACGVRLVPVGTVEDFHRLAKDPDFWHPVKGPWRVLCAAKEWFEPLSDAIAKLLKPAHAVLISSAPNFPATFAARKLARPHITVHLQPVAVFSAVSTPLMARGLGWFRYLPVPLKKWIFQMPTPIDWSLGRVLRKVCREANVPAPKALFREWWDSPDGVLCLFPDWFAAPQMDWPRPRVQTDFPLFDPVEKAGPEAHKLAEFLNHPEKPLVFTAGSAMGCPTEFFRYAAEAACSLKRRAVFVTAYPGKLPTMLPGNILVVRYVSFSRLFPGAAVAVHHGGIGTTAQAFAAGVPQLIISHSHDQPDNAERIGQLGCGLELPASRISARRLEERILRLLQESSFKENAAQIAGRLPAPGMASDAGPAVQGIEGFLRTRSGGH